MRTGDVASYVSTDSNRWIDSEDSSVNSRKRGPKRGSHTASSGYVDLDWGTWQHPTRYSTLALEGSLHKERGVSAMTFSLRKEVIQPQVLLRLPCYDFTPIMSCTLDGCLLAVSTPASSTAHFRDVTGGVYKARERIHRGVLIRDY